MNEGTKERERNEARGGERGLLMHLHCTTLLFMSVSTPFRELLVCFSFGCCAQALLYRK